MIHRLRRLQVSELTTIRILRRGVGSHPMLMPLGEKAATRRGVAETLAQAIRNKDTEALQQLRALLVDPRVIEQCTTQLFGRQDRATYREQIAIAAEGFILIMEEQLDKLSLQYGGLSTAARQAYIGIVYMHMRILAPAMIHGSASALLTMKEDTDLLPNYERLLVSLVQAELAASMDDSSRSAIAAISEMQAGSRPQLRVITMTLHTLNQLVASSLTRVRDLAQHLDIILGEVMRFFLSEATPAADVAGSTRFDAMRHDWTLVLAAFERGNAVRLLDATDGFAFQVAAERIGTAFAHEESELQTITLSEYRAMFRVEKIYDDLAGMPLWVHVGRSIDYRKLLAGTLDFFIRSSMAAPAGTRSALNAHERLEPDAPVRDSLRDMPVLWASVFGRDTQQKVLSRSVDRLRSTKCAWSLQLSSREAWTLAMSCADAIDVILRPGDNIAAPFPLPGEEDSGTLDMDALRAHHERLDMELVGTLERSWHPRAAVCFARVVDDGQFVADHPLTFLALQTVKTDLDRQSYLLRADGLMGEATGHASRGALLFAASGALPAATKWSDRAKGTVRVRVSGVEYRASLDKDVVLGERLLLSSELQLFEQPQVLDELRRALRYYSLAASLTRGDEGARLAAGHAWVSAQAVVAAHPRVSAILSHLRPTLVQVRGGTTERVALIDTRRAHDRALVVALRLAITRELFAILLGDVKLWKQVDIELDRDRIIDIHSNELFGARG